MIVPGSLPMVHERDGKPNSGLPGEDPGRQTDTGHPSVARSAPAAICRSAVGTLMRERQMSPPQMTDAFVTQG